MDVVTAFLQGDLKEDIYIVPPPGLTAPPGKEGCVWKLKKSLYGLKQSPRCWNEKISKHLVTSGFQLTQSDHGLYIKGTGPKMIALSLHVDDIVIAAKTEEDINLAKSILHHGFEMVDFGEARMVLGLQIGRDWDKGILTLSQSNFVLDLCSRFNQEEARVKNIPLAAGQRLSVQDCPSTEEQKTEMAKKPYRELVGSLLYLANSTRPDIAFTVSVLSRFCSNPGQAHWEAAINCLRYLKGTSTWGLVYTRQPELSLCGVVDANYAPGPDDSRSGSGYVFIMTGGPISWMAKRQKTTALSSTESEYIAANQAAVEVQWLYELFSELNLLSVFPVTVFTDNQSSMKLAGNPVFRERTRHIGVAHHKIRETIKEGKMELAYRYTKDLVADVLTKALPGDQHRKLVLSMGVGPCVQEGGPSGS
jgi:hypothetical protein